MGSLTTHENIPAEKFKQFHELLCLHGGRYVQTPYPSADEKSIRVAYSLDAGAESYIFGEEWMRLNRNIVEKRSDQWYKRYARRLKSLFRSKA